MDCRDLDQLPEPSGQGQLHVCGGQAPQEEEGGAGGIPLADGEDAVLAHAHLQVIHVAGQPHIVLRAVPQPDVHISVDNLHIHGLDLLGGQDGAGDPAAGGFLAALAEEAAPFPVVPGGKGPALLFFLLRLLLFALLRRGLRGRVLVVVHMDIYLTLKAVGIFLFDLLRHIADDLRRLVHGVLCLAHRLPDDALHTVEQLAGEIPHRGFLLRQLPLRAEAVQIGQQLVHIAQILQGHGVGVLLAGAAAGQVLPAAVEVVAQLLDQLYLCGGVCGGGQTLGNGNNEFGSDSFHGVYSSSKEIRASSKALVDFHSRQFSSCRRRPSSVMA